ncbi:LysM peptidoglycan-binding domain-containing protein [Candidatus Haliotispira prima]|uniref:LysM peptidoglycan-binding domain-containing protein n=1 Tax=Candidatus Haliotispira prima TaxID=3034016 RepID=A0ABY8MHW2_9SPIO|nr:LysM peptidoglycan-binding domain-containing protein [Candidatus Haliotispira prima]
MESERYLRKYFTHNKIAGIALFVHGKIEWNASLAEWFLAKWPKIGNWPQIGKFVRRPRSIFGLVLVLTLAAVQSGFLPYGDYESHGYYGYGVGKLYAGTLIYTIEDGDSLESISQRFTVSLAALVKINRFRSVEQAAQRIVSGESILIPEPETALVSPGSESRRAGPRIETAQFKATPLLDTARPASQGVQARAQSENAGDGRREHRVGKGDTLSSLAVRFDSTSARIRIINGLNSDKIRIGQVLRIPPADSAPALRAVTSRYTASNPPNQDRSEETSEGTYIVERGDTLLGISRETGVSVGIIRVLNQLEDDHIRPGQVLRISSYDHAVRTVAENRQGNLQSNLNRNEVPAYRYYAVSKGDTLHSVSRRFGISLRQLRKWNQFKNADLLRIGQKLAIGLQSRTVNNAPNGTNNSDTKIPVSYVVEKGNTLWSISRRFDLSVEDLRLYNPKLGKRGVLLRPGQTLTVGHRIVRNNLPETGANSGRTGTTAATAVLSDNSLPKLPNAYESKKSAEALTKTETETETLTEAEAFANDKEKASPKLEGDSPASRPRLPVKTPETPETKARPVALSAHFTRNAPRVPRQPNASYYEEFTDDPLENYETGRKLLAKFDKEIGAMPRLSDNLEGYSILIDPGHGGLDPGFNSQSEDGNGNALYIIEDEYNYDYALRLYRQLKRNGAHVGLTILSPNQLVVDSPDASRTLVSQKNEVYNSPFINQRGEYSSWPIGTPSGLHKRVEVAESFFNGTEKSKRIFISLHNDNSPWDKDGRLVLYYNDSLTIDKQGEQMAEELVPFLGKNAHMRGQSLAVLRKNPAKYAVLVELRNISYPRNSWAIRNADLRQEDTEMLTDGIIGFVRSLKK